MIQKVNEMLVKYNLLLPVYYMTLLLQRVFG